MNAMQPKTVHAILAGILTIALSVTEGAANARHTGTTRASIAPFVSTGMRFSTVYGRLPLQFEANRGQTDARVKFLARGPGYTIFLTATEAVMVLRQGKTGGPRSMREPPPLTLSRPPTPERASVVRMRLVGANARSAVTGTEELPGKVSYFLGNDPKKWRTNVPTFARVRFAGVYPGVDLVYYGNRERLEYDFVVAPGADPKRIRLAFEGADKVLVDGRGDLALRVAGSAVRFHKPRVYQVFAGQRREIAGGYVMGPPHEAVSSYSVAFRVAAYDTRRPLVIDPVLAYSTVLGGAGSDRADAVAVDDAGHAYVAGYTQSSDFPTTSGAFRETNDPPDAFVAKLSQDGGSLLYSTYLGGSGADYAYSLAVDGMGNAYVAGTSYSGDFPTTPGAFQQTHSDGSDDAFVTKVSATGRALVYSTYLAGSAGSTARAIALDSQGCAYVAGYTASTDFPTTAGAFQRQKAGLGYADVFLVKVNDTGSALVFSTYLGGTNFDMPWAVGVDGSGRAFVAGQTSSADFPTTPDAFQPAYGGGSGSSGSDCFVAKISQTGTVLLYSSYLGGSGNDYAYALAVDGSGNPFLAGYTQSTNFPTTPGAFQRMFAARSGHAFVAKMNGSTLAYSTYLGGSSSEWANGLAVDTLGNACVAGYTSSGDFPSTPDAFQPDRPSSYSSAFVAELNPTGSALLYSTYLGGSGGGNAECLALDGDRNIYVAGGPSPNDFPSTAKFGDGGAFVTKMARQGSGNGSATRLAFVVQPTGASSGAPLAPAVQVAIQDSDGNLVGSVIDTVFIMIANKPGSGRLLGTTASVTSNGVAVFPDLRIAVAGVGYRLKAISARGLAATTSGPFDITPGPPHRLTFLSSPGTTAAGTAFSPAVRVAIHDLAGNVVPSSTNAVTVGLADNPLSGTLSGTRTVPVIDGVATYHDLSIDKVSGRQYSLIASSPGLQPRTSSGFLITAGAPVRLGFIQRPLATRFGTLFSPAVRIGVQDRFGNLVTTVTDRITVAIAANPAGGSLSGTTTRTTADSTGLVYGAASFSDLRIDRPGRGYTLRATSSRLFTPATSLPFDITDGVPIGLAFKVQPRNVLAGSPLTPAVDVAVVDSVGSICGSATNSITVSLGANPKSGTLSGTPARTAIGGMARFYGLSVDKASGTPYSLVASSPGLQPATSAGFLVSAAAPVKLGFSVEPRNTRAGAPIAPAVKVSVQDRYGNLVWRASAAVSLALGVNLRGGTLSGTTAAKTTAGAATFSDLSVNRASGAAYTLKASAPGFPAATSRPFIISAGAPVNLAFVVQPRTTRTGARIAPYVRVLVQDALGNSIAPARNRITLTMGSNPSGGTLLGTTTVSAVNGAATFVDLKIDRPGAGYTLQATTAGLAGTVSTPFDITR